MIKRLIILAALYFVIGFQISLSAPIPGLAWDIDLVLIFLVILSAKVGRGEAILWAALAGLALDSFDIPAMGGQIVAKSSAIFLLGLIIDSMNMEQPALLAGTVFIMAILDRLIFRFFSPFAVNFGWNFLRFDLPSAIITALTGWILLMIAIRTGFFDPRATEDHHGR